MFFANLFQICYIAEMNLVQHELNILLVFPYIIALALTL